MERSTLVPESHAPTHPPAGRSRHHHQDAVKALADSHGIDTEYCHVLEGMPEDVIPKVAQDIDAEIVIIGTIGRTGLSAAIIGNTAEHVIDRLDCDILALKPEHHPLS